MPLASISKVTWICGTPRGAGGISDNSNRPNVLLLAAIGLSPWSTWISTDGWLSLAVENTWLLDVGIVVFLLIIVVNTPPSVSIPRDNGVTSRRRTSLTSPFSTPAWIAAPTATDSSGLTLLLGSLPNLFLISVCTAGIREEPPTRRTLSISFTVSPASFNAKSIGSIVSITRSSVILSNMARVRAALKCTGCPFTSMVINGRLMSVDITLDNSIFAFSAASFKRWLVIGSRCNSKPFCALKVVAIQSIIRASKSSPPRCPLPWEASTSNTPSAKFKMDTSKVPPPRS